jgi:hypothetical protein
MMKTLKISVTDASVLAYWIAVDDQDVEMENGVGVCDVEPGDHMMFYYTFGAPGQSITTSVSVDGQVIAKPPKSSIQPGYTRGGGVRKLIVA